MAHRYLGSARPDFANANAQTGVVYVYFGAASPIGIGWNGASPPRRLTLIGPDAAASQYGGMR